MQRYVHQVAGEEVVINRVESLDDLEDFRNFVRNNLNVLACDSEGTGLDIYSADFGLRLVQLGTSTESYVIPVEHGGQFVTDTCRALRGVQKLVFQNGMFDLQVFDKHLGVKMEELWPKVLDTKILAHLVDPRGREEGGIGHGLEALTAHYVDSSIAENVKGLMAKIAKEYKTTKNKIWSLVDLDHEEYNLYAGMDTILAARLSRKLIPLVPEVSQGLVSFEHKVAEVCSYMERNGFLLDVEYTEGLAKQLREEEEYYKGVAAQYGVDKVNSTEQVADALEALGVRITGRTPKGRRQVNDALLSGLAEKGNELANAVVLAKQASKRRTSWVEKFLNNRDENDRCHANINALRARTARMSITGIPAQTLPSGDWMIRRCFLADEGHVIGSIDYKTQELRVLAALAGDQTMLEIFKNDGDLHLMTARSAFGEHIQKDSVEREKYAKTANFQKVYGGGPKSLSETLGIPLEVSQAIHKGFDKAYPGVGIYNRKLMKQAQRQGYIVTPSGRRLPVDPDRAYAALNYMVQSTSRDVTCRALVRLYEAGFIPYLRLPIHDEVVTSLPATKAEWGAQQIAKHMAEDMGPVFIGTDPKIGKRSWGSLYGADY